MINPRNFSTQRRILNVCGNTKVRSLRWAHLVGLFVACGSSWSADVTLYSTSGSVVWASCLRAFNPTSLYCRRPPTLSYFLVIIVTSKIDDQLCIYDGCRRWVSSGRNWRLGVREPFWRQIVLPPTRSRAISWYTSSARTASYRPL